MGYNRPEVECACGKLHKLSPTAMAVVITASTRGLMHKVTPTGIASVCILEAFDHKEIMERYDGRQITYGDA